MSSGTAKTGGAAAVGAGIGFAAGGPLGALVGAGIATTVVGQLMSADDQAEIDRQKAQLAEEQAGEIEQREMANEAIRATETYKAKLDFGAQVAGTGHAGTGIGSQLEIQRQSDLQTMISRKEADFQEYMLRKTGSMDLSLADSTEEAGRIGAFSTLLTGAAKFASPSSGATKYNQPQGLPPWSLGANTKY